MDALEAIQSRRSIRIYTGEPIPTGDLEKIIDAGRLAPTGGNLQPWDFVVVTNPEMIAHFTIGAEWVSKAAAIVVVVVDPHSRWWVEDGSAATENILIASTALGYGACWLEGFIPTREKEYKEFLGIPEGRRIFTLITIGLPAESPVKEKRTLEQVLHWEHF